MRRAFAPAVLALAVSTLVAGTTAAALPRVETRVEPSVIHVGDSVRVTIRITPGDGVETPAWSERVGAFELLNVARGDSAGSTLLRAVVTTFELGDVVFPSLPVAVRGPAGVDTVRSGTWRVSVSSLLPADSAAVDSASYRPGAGPLDLPGRFQWGALVFYLLFAAALAAVVWWLRTHRPARKLIPVLEPAAIVRAPDVVALEALDAVAARAYVERGLFKPHYTEALDALRVYIEGRYGIEALDRTSLELSRSLAAAGVAESFRSRFDRLQEEADLVKFAKWTPDAGAAVQLLAAARAWVRETTTAAALTASSPTAATAPGGRGAAPPAGEGAA